MTKICISTRRAFTLIELLVVVSIIALLVSIMLPALGRAREQARRAVCGSNTKQILTASYMYAIDNNGVFPLVIAPHPEAGDMVRFYQPQALAAALDYHTGLGLLERGNIIGDRQTLFCPSGFRTVPYSPSSVYVNYYWRFLYRTQGTDAPGPGHWRKVDRLHPSTAVAADVFAKHYPSWGRGPQHFWHQDGMNVGYTDSSVSWWQDEGNVVRDYFEVNYPGEPYHVLAPRLVNQTWPRLDR